MFEKGLRKQLIDVDEDDVNGKNFNEEEIKYNYKLPTIVDIDNDNWVIDVEGLNENFMRYDSGSNSL